MQTKSQSLAFVGPGNVAHAIYTGHLNHDETAYDYSNMHLVSRKYFDDDIRNGHRDILLKDFQNVLLCVKPADAVHALHLMKGEIAPNSLLLSTVSTLSTRVINDILDSTHSRTEVVKMTLNTCVSTQNGIIVYSTANDDVARRAEGILSPLARKIVRVGGNEINPYVLIIGSGHGCTIQHLLVYWKKYYSGIPLMEFLGMLDCEHECIAPYIDVMEQTSKKLCGRSDLIRPSFESTVAHLIKMGCHTKEDLMNQIDIVATNKGCTRRIVNNYQSPEQTTTKFFFEEFTESYVTVCGFEKKILADYKALMKRKNQPAKVNVEGKSPYFAKVS